ncbi:MAG: hypothetical protein ACRC7V_00540 [Lachnospiraceae bacterium]
MKKKNFSIIVLFCAILLLLFSGCSKQSEEMQWDSSCHIYVDNLPQEYFNLSQGLKDATSIYISLNNSLADKSYSIKLTDTNNYSEEINVLPGTYTVSSIYAINTLLTEITVVASKETFIIEPNTTTPLAITILNPESLSQSILKNMPSNEIINETTYSRKVQYEGTIYDMQSIPDKINFTGGADKNVNAGDIAYLYSEEFRGLSMIIQNTQQYGMLPATECEFIGFYFSRNNVTLPKGLTVGMSLEPIVNAQSGLLGTPDYCLGTPFIGMDIADSTLVYIDKISGDRISIKLNSRSKNVESISYEFNRYN